MFNWVTLGVLADYLKVSLADKRSEKVLGISTDSRKIKKGEVFIALRGPQFDGNKFASDAVKSGAIAVIADEALSLSVPVLQVKDGLLALIEIAKSLRKKFNGTVFSITGSAGKSSTKEMTRTLLGENTIASPASFNNLNGVSQTVCLLTDTTQNLVLEMGMNALGEIRELVDTFRPNIGLITNIGDAHLGMVGGKEGVYRAKKEMFDVGSDKIPDFKVGLNLDDSLVLRAYEESFSKKKPETVTYSCDSAKKASVKFCEAKLSEETAQLCGKVHYGGESWEVSLPLFGLHHSQNISAALALASLRGVSSAEIRQRILTLRPAKHRGEIQAFGDSNLLIDESYNSNPSALKSALKSLSCVGLKRRHLIVLGDMRELGEYSAQLHVEVAEWLVNFYSNRPSKPLLFGVGPEMRALKSALEATKSGFLCKQVASVQEVIPLVKAELKPGDVLFVKGSRLMQLDALVGQYLFN